MLRAQCVLVVPPALCFNFKLLQSVTALQVRVHLSWFTSCTFDNKTTLALPDIIVFAITVTLLSSSFSFLLRLWLLFLLLLLLSSLLLLLLR